MDRYSKVDGAKAKINVFDSPRVFQYDQRLTEFHPKSLIVIITGIVIFFVGLAVLLRLKDTF